MDTGNTGPGASPDLNRFRLVLVFVALVLAGCDTMPHPLKVGSNQWPGYETVYLARDLGLLGRRIKLVELPSSTDVMQHLRDGNLDAGMLTLDETIGLVGEGVPLRVVLVMDLSNGADVVLARPGIEELADLRGKRVGVELSAVGTVMLESLLEAAHLGRGDIRLVNLPVDRQEAAYRAGEVDVVVTFEPTRSRLLALGAHELFSSRAIPGRIVDVLAVRADALDHHAPQVRKLVAAHFQALAELETHPQQALRRIAPRLWTTPERLRQAYEGLILPDLDSNRRWLREGGELLPRAEALAALMVRWGLLPATPDLSHLADDRFLPHG